MNSPPKKAPGKLGSEAGRKLTARASYHALDLLQARAVLAVWQREAARLFREFWRTGGQRHLAAFVKHVVAMRAHQARAAQ